MSDELSVIERDLYLISSKLAESLHLDDILYSFLEKEIISLQLYDEFMRANDTDSTRAQHFVKYVTKKPALLKDFIKALLKEGLKELAGHISPTITDSYSLRVRKGLPSDGSPCTPISPHQTMKFPSSHSFPAANNCNVPLKIKVKSRYRISGDERENKDIYKNSTSPQGFLFIVNFFSFDNDMYPTRPGSNVDVENLTQLFSQIGYKVLEPCINPSKFELIQTIEKFRDSKALAEVDSCVVAIMSHGKGEMAFLTSDNKVLQYVEILEFFNNKGCPSLFGKPKLFIFQCCRGPIADDGVGIVPQLVSNTMEMNTDAAFMGKTNTLSSSPSFTDMYMIHSSFQGFVSYRSPERGSWLIEALCIELMENCLSEDLDSLMRMVSRRLKALYSNKGKKQICEFRNVGFDKRLYFNPIFIPDLSTNSSRVKNFNDLREKDIVASKDFDEHDGSASHYKAFKLMAAQKSSKLVTNHKRQLSNYSDAEAEKLCNSLAEYLKINDMPDMLVSAKEINSEIQRKKTQHKRRKTEDDEDQIT